MYVSSLCVTVGTYAIEKNKQKILILNRNTHTMFSSFLLAKERENESKSVKKEMENESSAYKQSYELSQTFL